MERKKVQVFYLFYTLMARQAWDASSSRSPADAQGEALDKVRRKLRGLARSRFLQRQEAQLVNAQVDDDDDDATLVLTPFWSTNHNSLPLSPHNRMWPTFVACCRRANLPPWTPHLMIHTRMMTMARAYHLVVIMNVSASHVMKPHPMPADTSPVRASSR